MPQVTDVGNEPQVFIQSRSRSCWNMKSVINTTETKTWGTKWHKFSTRTPTYRTKLPKNTKRNQKSSKRTPLWLWSRKQYPPICSLDTARTDRPTLERKISPHGENHFSKRRSESESYNKCKSINSKSERKSESKDVEVKNESRLVTFSTDAKTKVTAKADKVKTIRKTQTEFRMEIGKQLDKNTGSDVPVTLPLHFATTFNISVLIRICVTFTIFISIFIILILIFNPLFSDLFDHHFQTFSLGNLRVYEMLCASQKTASSQAKTTVTAFATPDSIRSFRVPETRPNILYRNYNKTSFLVQIKFITED
jgi:hypothetical protein